MVNSIQIFNNAEFGKVRAMIIDNEPWMVGNDIAVALGYKYPKNAIRDNVDIEDKKLTQLSDFQQGEQTPPPNEKSSKIMIINESGMYSLIFGSKLSSAKKFKRWVTSEVLPTLRKNGYYGEPKQQPKVEIGLNRQALIIDLMAEKIENLQKEIAELKLRKEADNITQMPELAESFIVEEYSGEIIRKCRETANMTQTGICKALNMSRSGLIKIETNKHRPLATAFINLLKAMNYVVIIKKTNNN